MSISLQKANFWKRLSAYMFDFILAAILTVGAASGISALLQYDKYSEQLNTYYTEHFQSHGIEKYTKITEEEYNELPPEEQTKIDNAIESYRQDDKVARINQLQFYMTLVILGGSLLITHLVLYFLIPLFFDNGQTLGKKIFGIALMRSNCVKVTGPVLFIRAIFGQFTMETMFPALIMTMIAFGVLGSVGLITLALFVILQIGVLVATRTNSTIHDLVADTVAIDFASQMIFDTEEKLIAYKEEEARKQAEAQQT